MNNTVILFNIALQIDDYQTLTSLMFVSKTALKAVKHVINIAPTLYITDVNYDRWWHENERAGKQVFTSLKQLFQEHYQYRLSNPRKMDGINVDNYAGPCVSCMKDWYARCGGEMNSDFFNPNVADKYKSIWTIKEDPNCGCTDIHYGGIKVIKYFHCDEPIINFLDGIKITKRSNNGYILSTHYDTPAYIKNITNRKSIYYLYAGLYTDSREHRLLKLGLRKWKKNNYESYYPVTTDTIEHFIHHDWQKVGKEKYLDNDLFYNNKLLPYYNMI